MLLEAPSFKLNLKLIESCPYQWFDANQSDLNFFTLAMLKSDQAKM